ncbi:TetR/AcrR family transcriptional regulator [Streptomyces deccanensis]|uniref:TetR/AcrR family transcriptional regulator n=1 Tax=Streptomyces deccanensis TaxID=424188 RepID=UPI001EFA3EF5|nr:TetR/AcrR family transcriptional regulator [Streptomyces deccanensis]ULR48526.1 TetR/AcrR family transcriptional regulator [Streptomyces deccanensis]
MARPKNFDPDVAVEQAMAVFWRQGYGATTPQQLVDSLQIGKGSLYNAFGGKRQLFDLALRRYLDLRLAAVTTRLEGPGPAKERLRTALHFLVDSYFTGPDRRGCLATNSAVEFGYADEAVAAQVRKLFDRIESSVRALIEEGQRAGEFPPDRDAGALASMLLNTFTGMNVLARIEPGPDRLRRVVDTTVDLL